MKGYWNLPDATAGHDHPGRAGCHTGDVGRVDEDGYFYIVDRNKDLIIRGGYNVYPREIEEVLYEHPAVAEAAVIGIPHDSLGEEVGAAVALKEGASVHPDELRDYVKERVAAYKYPRQVWIVDALPKGPTGKVQKRDITDSRQRAKRPPNHGRTSRGGRQAAKRRRAGGATRPATDQRHQALRPPDDAERDLGPLRPRSLAKQPGAVAEPGTHAGPRAGSIAVGQVATAPRHAADKRFSDPAWQENPLLHRIMQAYLAGTETAWGLLDDAQLDWRDTEKMQFVMDNLVEGLAPSNNPLISPLGWKALIDTGGLSAVRGAEGIRPGHGLQAPDARDDRARRLRGGGDRGGHQRGGRPANQDVRTDPVRAADTARCARFRCCWCRR